MTRERLPTRVLGKTGVPISMIGFGTAPAGNRLGLKDAVRLYEEALNLGVTYFDTAPDFAGYGRAQEQLGYLLKERRREAFLVTKCYEPSGDAALRLLEHNLRELQTDYAGLVFVHSIGADKMDPRVVFGRNGCYGALVKAKAQGLTRFVGLSGHNRPGRFVETLKRIEVDALLNAVNFVDRHTYDFEQRVWPLAARQNIGLMAMKVYGGKRRGFLTGISHTLMPEQYRDLAFRYTFSQPNLARAAIGMATRLELRENVERARRFTPLTRAERDQLDGIGRQLARNWGPHFGAVA